MSVIRSESTCLPDRQARAEVQNETGPVFSDI